ncbi:MAG: dephospho-CoA kinase [Clostridia bacterium]|nr:dephospho-CoA kinase [Clostridia bacterium]
MIVIGVTGGSGSGKSCFCQQLRDLCHAPVIDADAVYHSLIVAPSPCTEALADAFGAGVLCEDGSLNRPRLASVVFCEDDSAKAKLAQLNSITHQFVRLAFEERLAEYQKKEEPVVILDVPLLFESGFDAMCDYTVGVLATYKARLARIMARDCLTAEAASRRLAAQPDDDFYKKRCNAVVYNHGETVTLKKEAEQIASQLGLLLS